MTIETILNALRNVDDPDLKKDIVTLGMVKDVAIAGKQVSFTVVLTTPACPMKEHIRNACINAIKLLVSADLEVVVTMTANVTTQSNNATLPAVKKCNCHFFGQRRRRKIYNCRKFGGCFGAKWRKSCLSRCRHLWSKRADFIWF